MVICSTGPPLTALVTLIFALLLASAPHSHSNAAEPPPPLPLRNPRSAPPLPPPPTPLKQPPLPPQRPRKQGPLPPLRNLGKSRGLNLGKKVGLSFAGIAVLTQFVAVGFLAYKKNQLFQIWLRFLPLTFPRIGIWLVALQ